MRSLLSTLAAAAVAALNFHLTLTMNKFLALSDSKSIQIGFRVSMMLAGSFQQHVQVAKSPRC